ncbi:MAG: hypothetical protein AAFR17_04285 [Pseudomonadota bacterium]
MSLGNFEMDMHAPPRVASAFGLIFLLAFIGGVLGWAIASAIGLAAWMVAGPGAVLGFVLGVRHAAAMRADRVKAEAMLHAQRRAQLTVEREKQLAAFRRQRAREERGA